MLRVMDDLRRLVDTERIFTNEVLNWLGEQHEHPRIAVVMLPDIVLKRLVMGHLCELSGWVNISPTGNMTRTNLDHLMVRVQGGIKGRPVNAFFVHPDCHDDMRLIGKMSTEPNTVFKPDWYRPR